jgi:hypothetical protein
MSRARRREGERGTAAIELALCLLWIVFAMMLLIGLGYTLLNKQQGLVAARFAAFYEAGTERAPGPRLATAAINSRESWGVTPGFDNSSDSAVSQSGLQGALGVIGGAFNSLMGALGGSSTLTYTARTTPTRGLLPRLHTWNVAEHYTLANGTWTCDKVGGDYISATIGRLPFPLPDLSCCKTYQRR